MRIYSKLPQDFTAGIDGEAFTLKGNAVTEVDEAIGQAWLAHFEHCGPVQDGLIGVVPERKTRREGK